MSGNHKLSKGLANIVFASLVAAQPAFASTFFSPTHISQLQAYCNGESATPVNGMGKRKLILFHKDGYIMPQHYELPRKIRADQLWLAGAVLCIDDEQVNIEECRFGLFFHVARKRSAFRVTARPLTDSNTALVNGLIEGRNPASCEDLGVIDNTVTEIAGPSPDQDGILDFLERYSLDWRDSDRDGLTNLQEFVFGSAPDNDGDPALQSAVRIGGGHSANLLEGDFVDIRIDFIPAEHLGKEADYYFWADTPNGMYVHKIPGVFRQSDSIEPSITAPAVPLLNFPVYFKHDWPPGKYVFHFEIVGTTATYSASSAELVIAEDACRQEVSLPIDISDTWNSDCFSTAGNHYGRPARYYSFTLQEQSRVQLEMDAGGHDARILLRWAGSRTGFVLAKSLPFAGKIYLEQNLFAGTYTLEVLLDSEASPLPGFFIKASDSGIPWHFSEISLDAGIGHAHALVEDPASENFDRLLMTGGVASGDYDGDGWIDLYATGGSAGRNFLYRNKGDGTFEETGDQAGVSLEGSGNSGAVFADIDGDGWPDLFVTGVNGTPPTLFRNMQNGTFADITAAVDFPALQNSFSASFGDYDLDGDLDLYVTHWNDSYGGNYLFRNDGDFRFVDVSHDAGIPDGLMADYTPHFTDLNNDGWPDLLVTADFGTSQVFINNRNGTFRTGTTDTITDDNGMGSAVGDFDNDGDIDWFVSSIFDPNGLPRNALAGTPTGTSGNRLYRNRGDGTFDDVTEWAGVRMGGWGWGSCFADFNNDGHLDIFHVNGFITQSFVTSRSYLTDASRLFVANGDGTFHESARDLGLVDLKQGRGIVCFDYDRDGDMDIFVANNQDTPGLFRNDGGNNQNFLHLKIAGEDMNSSATGTRIYVTAGGMTQMREIASGNNFLSNNPPEAHFGLDRLDRVDEIRVVWPSGQERILRDVAANQFLTISR